MAVTFTLVDGSTVTGVTTYARVSGTRGMPEGNLKAMLDAAPHYTVFSPAGHRYIPVDEVAHISSARDAARPMGWFDLPMAAGMWAADGADMGA
jgi:hypothetical protein